MKAKEMFEELGYKCCNSTDKIEYYQGERENYVVVRFGKIDKEIELFGAKFNEFDLENYMYFYDNYKLFVAINKQIEELGWD